MLPCRAATHTAAFIVSPAQEISLVKIWTNTGGIVIIIGKGSSAFISHFPKGNCVYLVFDCIYDGINVYERKEKKRLEKEHLGINQATKRKKDGCI